MAAARRLLLSLFPPCLLAACSGVRGWGDAIRTTEAPAADGRLFTRLPSSYTGVRSEKRLTDTRALEGFDGTGSAEQIVTSYSGGHGYPLVLRDDPIRSLPALKARYLIYRDYARATVTDVFPPKELADAVVRTASTFATTLVRNDGSGRSTLVPLPREAQLSPVYGIVADDVDGDGKTDLLLGGNLGGSRPEVGRMGAGYGRVLRGDDRGAFTPLRAPRSGGRITGQTRDIQRVRTRDGVPFVFARNDDRAVVLRANSIHPD